jgi:hypothetical protein
MVLVVRPVFSLSLCIWCCTLHYVSCSFNCHASGAFGVVLCPVVEECFTDRSKASNEWCPGMLPSQWILSSFEVYDGVESSGSISLLIVHGCISFDGSMKIVYVHKSMISPIQMLIAGKNEVWMCGSFSSMLLPDWPF